MSSQRGSIALQLVRDNLIDRERRMKIIVWLIGFLFSFFLFMDWMDSGHQGRATILALVAIAVFGPGFFRMKQRSFEQGLGTKRAKDGMRRD